MLSIKTNTSAMTALQNLSNTQKEMEKTQARISTGLRVGSASDNAAYWSIATTMQSDNSALSTVRDALNLGSATIDTANAGLTASKDLVNQIKTKLVAAAALVESRRGELTEALRRAGYEVDAAAVAARVRTPEPVLAPHRADAPPRDGQGDRQGNAQGNGQGNGQSGRQGDRGGRDGHGDGRAFDQAPGRRQRRAAPPRAIFEARRS